MKTCANREEWLGALAYGDLPFDEEAQAEEHLSACDACRGERESLARLVRALPAPAPVPAAVPRRRRWLVAAAAAFAGAVVGFAAARRTEGPGPAEAAARAAPVQIVTPEAAAFLRGGAPALTDRQREALARFLGGR